MKAINIYKLAVAFVAVSLGFTSCSDEYLAEETTMPSSQVVEVGGLKFQIGDYPSSELRSVDGFSAGKTKWENGDNVKVYYSIKDSVPSEFSSVVFTYKNSSWVTNDVIAKQGLSTVEIFVLAYYTEYTDYNCADAPDVNIKGDKEFLLFMTAGSGNEGYVPADQTIVINLSRQYSRLRVYVGAGSKDSVTLSGVGFEKNGQIPLVSGEVIKSKPDEDGNAYFYGTWKKNTVLTINGEEFTMPESVDGKSYAINMKSALVEVSAGKIIVREGGVITTEIIAEAIGEGSELIVEGTIPSLVDLINVVDGYADEEIERELVLDLSNCVLPYGAQPGTKRKYAIVPFMISSLKMPNSLTTYPKYFIDADKIDELYVGNVESVKSETFINTKDTELYINGVQTDWENVSWNVNK